jgi:hypothetical protein
VAAVRAAAAVAEIADDVLLVLHLAVLALHWRVVIEHVGVLVLGDFSNY